MLWYNSFNIGPNEMKLAVCTLGGVINIPTKFEAILKKLNFWWILGILSNFSFKTVISTFMALECLKFIRKTASVKTVMVLEWLNYILHMFILKTLLSIGDILKFLITIVFCTLDLICL